MEELIKIMNKNLNLLLQILGMILQLIGGLILSLEAFSIKNYFQYRNDGCDHHKRHANMELISSVNQVSVFLLVNFIWYLLLILYFKFSIQIALLLYFIGFYIWKFLIKSLKLLAAFIYKLQFKYKESEGCFMLLIKLPFIIAWAAIYLLVNLIALLFEFGIDLPLRIFAEKIISKIILKCMEALYDLLLRIEKQTFKSLYFIGAILILIGFLYQLFGVIFSFAK